jgi:hypothetical protein
VNWTVVALAAIAAPVVAWAMWLAFNALIAKWHGLDGLKATPLIAIAFRPQDWRAAVPKPPLPRSPTDDNGAADADAPPDEG